MSERMGIEGRLSFCHAAARDRAIALLRSSRGSVFALFDDALEQHGLLLRFAIETTASAKCFDATARALDQLHELRDARGYAETWFGSDEAERVTFERRIAEPSPFRTCSRWWSQSKPPRSPDDELPADVDEWNVDAIYATSSEAADEDLHTPSFVVGPTPGRLLPAVGVVPYGGPMWEIEATLNEVLATRAMTEVVRGALLEALSWVQRRPEPFAVVFREPEIAAGEGTARAAIEW